VTSVYADRLFRIAFATAGLYNVAFGLWAGLRPQSFFEIFELPAPRYPAIWACLGMLVGVYGLLYWYAAARLDRARPIIAVGLLGKVLGPVGMAMTIGDDWPRRLAMLCVGNDLIWWLPFGLFLIRGTSASRWAMRAAPWLCIAAHAAGLAAMAVVLQPGTTAGTDSIAERAAYIASRAGAWSAGWAVWMTAALSIVGFYAWWGGWLMETDVLTHRTWSTWVATLAVLCAAAGMVCDLTGESLSVFVLVDLATSAALDEASFLGIERTSTLLTAGVANGLYTVGGMLLMFATHRLPSWIRAAMWGTWLAGAVMTVSAFAGSTTGIIAATVVLFPLLILWVGWMAIRGRPA
jgi:hypothetical protein